MARNKVSPWLNRAQEGDSVAFVYLRREYSFLIRQLLKNELRKAKLSARMPTERRLAELVNEIWLRIDLDAIYSENQLACLLTRLVKYRVQRLRTNSNTRDVNIGQAVSDVP